MEGIVNHKPLEINLRLFHFSTAAVSGRLISLHGDPAIARIRKFDGWIVPVQVNGDIAGALTGLVGRMIELEADTVATNGTREVMAWKAYRFAGYRGTDAPTSYPEIIQEATSSLIVVEAVEDPPELRVRERGGEGPSGA